MPRGAWLAVGAIAAALLAAIVGPGSPTVLVAWGALALTPVAAVLVAARRPRDAALVVGIASLGLRLTLGGLGAPPPTVAPQTAIEGAWTARVLTLGSTADGLQRAALLIEASDPPVGVSPASPWRVYAWLPRYPSVIPTDHIAFDAKVEPVRQDGSEFAGYLADSDIVATVRIGRLTVLATPEDPFGIAERLRDVADDALARVLPEPMAGLASGILVGRRDRVASEVADSFTTTGLSHVVAISGWNICLVAGVVGGILGATRMSRRSRTIAIVVALAGFTLLAGASASVVRAALMGGVALLARETGRPGSAAAALGLAVWCLLLLDPAMVSDIGFQLSVAATAGLLAWGSGLAGWMEGASAGRPRRWLAQSLGVSLAAQAATLPLVLFHFGRLSLVSPVANLLVAPLVAPAMLVGVIALLAGLAVGAGLPFVVGAPFALLGWVVLGAMVAISGLFSALPGASLELPPVVATALSLGLTGVLATVVWRARIRSRTPQHRPTGPVAAPIVRPVPGERPSQVRLRRHRALLAIGLGVVVAVAGIGMVVAGRPGTGRLSVTVLDVGQGDAILVRGPAGGRILIDGGPDPARLMLVLDQRLPAWDRRLDLVILSHPHEDHVAGLAMLLDRYRVAAIAENGMRGSGPGDAALRQWLGSAQVTTRRIFDHDRLVLDGVPIDVRWPHADEVPARAPSSGRAVNDSSIVLDIRYGQRRMLLTGDVEDDVDPRLLAAGIHDPNGQRLDVLKVAHHGSRSATSAAWLDALRPRVAMISAGTRNPYGHPAADTIRRLEERQARVLRTDLDGSIEVSTDGIDLRVATSGGRPMRRASTPVRSMSASRTPGLPALDPFLCAIPLSAARMASLPGPPRARPASGTPMPPEPSPRAPAIPRDPVVGFWSASCYDRPDHGADPCGRGRPPLVPLALEMAATTRHGRGRRGVIPGRWRTSRGPPRGPGSHRDRSLVARPGQGASHG